MPKGGIIKSNFTGKLVVMCLVQTIIIPSSNIKDKTSKYFQMINQANWPIKISLI